VEGELRRFQTTGNLDDNTESLDVKYMFNAPFSGILTLRYYFVSIMLTFLNVYSGNLFLTELGGVTIQSRCGIEAAISLCPQLQGISFVSNVNTASADLLTTEELKVCLEKLSLDFQEANDLKDFMSMAKVQLEIDNINALLSSNQACIMQESVAEPSLNTVNNQCSFLNENNLISASLEETIMPNGSRGKMIS
jgi:hypothetical protein